MKDPRKTEHHAIAKAVVEQVASYFPEDNSAHGPAEANQSGYRTNNILREEIRGQNHHKRRPGLLPEISHTKERDGPGDGDMRNEDDQRHQRRAQAER